MKSYQLIMLCLMATGLTACGAADRLRNVGKEPRLSAIESPTSQPGYKPVQMPMPTEAEPVSYSPNSLWQTGSRAFFKDQRANRVGDILTVKVRIPIVPRSTTRPNAPGQQRTIWA